MKNEICILAATGMLGTGFSEDSFERALSMKPDVIGCDAGSTDSGPYYLGAGISNKSRTAVKRDLRIMIQGGMKHGIPVLVGSAGTSGGRPHLQWTLDIVKEIAAEDGLHFKLAAIDSEIDKDTLKDYMKRGKLKELYPAPEFTENMVDKLERAVGVMGPEPYIEALQHGAQVVIAGRSSDTSIYAAVPIMMGFDHASAWHAAKIIECGAGCVESRIYPDCMMAWVREDSFSIEPPNPHMRCTPVSCISHTLYENANPYVLVEPGGVLYTEHSSYIAETDRRVRVQGGRYEHSPKYTIRIEGVEKIGYRQFSIGAIKDPLILKQLDSFLDNVRNSIHKKVKSSIGLEPDDYHFQVRVYGNSTKYIPEEVGVVLEAVAETEHQAKNIMSIAWHTALHQPIPEWSGLQSQIAFPFSPPGINAGVAYRFCINHVLEVDDPLELFPIVYQQL